MVVRDLYNVRPRPEEGADPVAPEAGVTPLTDEEERRYQAVLFGELGNTVAERGWARWPAYTPEDRRRLVEVARRLAAHWGQQVFVEAEDECRLRLCLAEHRSSATALPARP
ncbi:hypothetical protein [Streptomyces sp. NBRC 109706]|uniref:hypothetical protein n=1 Tax=Streptomyces sp. NBRC 109706 TaxID=1550035 RepID=UPI000AE35394|nr:hypothetical protein [Streptomyces sp. NBRC 109706]